MKLMLLLCFVLWGANAIASAPGPDIILQTKLDPNNSSMLIERARNVLINNGFGDPYKFKLKKPMNFSLDSAIGSANEDSQEWLTNLQNFLKIKFFESRYDLQINDFSYDISDYEVELNAKREDGVFIFSAKNKIYKPELTASSIKLIVSLNRSGLHQPIFFEIAIMKPVFRISKEASVDILMGWESVLKEKKLNIHFKEVDLTQLFLDLSQDTTSYDLDWSDLIVPDLKITVGNKTIKVEKEKLKQYIRDNKDQMKAAIIDVVLTQNQINSGGKFLLKPDLKISIPGEFGFKSDINGHFQFVKESLISPHVIRHDINGTFCLPGVTAEIFSSCEGHVQPLPPKRDISPAQYQQSVKMFQDYFAAADASIGLSVSEEYINRLIRTLAEGGRFNANGKDFELGSKLAFAISEVKGKEFSIYVDVIYKTTRAQRLLIGKKQLRFPIKLLAKLSLENINEIPYLMIDVTKHVSTDDMLKFGLPRYGMPSNVDSTRFTRKVLKGIRKGVATFVGKRLVEVDLEEMKGSYLEDMKFMSDGQGRAMAIVKLSR